MKALVSLGPSQKALQDRPKPEITIPSDTIAAVSL
jgi:hypothetical protein